MNDQRSAHCVGSFYQESVFKLALVGWFTLEDCEPDEAHRPTALFVLVPQHYLEAAAIMTAVNPKLLSPFLHNLRRGLFKGNTLHFPCEESQFMLDNPTGVQMLQKQQCLIFKKSYNIE